MPVEQFRSGQWLQQYQYKSFSPTPINCEWQWLDPQLNTLLERASLALAELNALSLMVPDGAGRGPVHPHAYRQGGQHLQPYRGRPDADGRGADAQGAGGAGEARRLAGGAELYRGDINTAVEDLQQLPLSIRVLKQTHAVLMQGVRGDHRMPGEFRTSQNWIGGSNLNNAVFVPPHPSEVPELMGDLEKFWHNEQVLVPDLIRIALGHYQFETIHP